MHSHILICFSLKFCNLFFLYLAAATDLSCIIVWGLSVKMPQLNYQVDDYICVNAWFDNGKKYPGCDESALKCKKFKIHSCQWWLKVFILHFNPAGGLWFLLIAEVVENEETPVQDSFPEDWQREENVCDHTEDSDPQGPSGNESMRLGSLYNHFVTFLFMFLSKKKNPIKIFLFALCTRTRIRK